MIDEERLQELLDTCDSLEVLKNNLKSKDLKDDVNYILEKYEDEKNCLLVEINKQWEDEERQANNEFERSRL